MPHNEIPSAFLIRALARHEAQHCNRCGHRMFVKGPSGLCPLCFSDRPARPAEFVALPVSAAEPFLPRLDGTRGWQRFPIARRFRLLVQLSRRAGIGARRSLALSAHTEAPHPSTS
jgi:hypothetical protein